MRIVVTGSLGFVGGAICALARDYGHEIVLGIDDLSGNVYDDPRHEFIRHTLGAPAPFFWEHISSYHADVVIHTAAPVGSAGILGRRCVQEMVNATDDAVEMAAMFDARLINISSSEVYGAPGTNYETTPSVVPNRFSDRMTYAVGKLAAEHVAEQRARQHGVPLAQVRPFNLVGHKQDSGKGFVVPRFAQAAVSGADLTVFGDGLQQRAFTHVEDFARFVLGLLDQPTATAWNGVPFNVGSEANRCTIIDLAHWFTRITGKGQVLMTDGKQVFGPGYEEAEAKTKLPGISRAHVYGWNPQWSLDAIVAGAIADAKIELAREATTRAQHV